MAGSSLGPYMVPTPWPSFADSSLQDQSPSPTADVPFVQGHAVIFLLHRPLMSPPWV